MVNSVEPRCISVVAKMHISGCIKHFGQPVGLHISGSQDTARKTLVSIGLVPAVPRLSPTESLGTTLPGLYRGVRKMSFNPSSDIKSIIPDIPMYKVLSSGGGGIGGTPQIFKPPPPQLNMPWNPLQNAIVFHSFPPPPKPKILDN